MDGVSKIILATQRLKKFAVVLHKVMDLTKRCSLGEISVNNNYQSVKLLFRLFLTR